jgi:hypothetical protein
MKHEALILATYLGVKNINPELEIRYETAIRKLTLNLTKKEEKTLNNILKMPKLLPFIDGGLAFLNPNHGIRKRILVMSTLIETDPQYHAQFLNHTALVFPLVSLLWQGGVGVLKGILGVLLLMILGWK